MAKLAHRQDCHPTSIRFNQVLLPLQRSRAQPQQGLATEEEQAVDLRTEEEQVVDLHLWLPSSLAQVDHPEDLQAQDRQELAPPGAPAGSPSGSPDPNNTSQARHRQTIWSQYVDLSPFFIPRICRLATRFARNWRTIPSLVTWLLFMNGMN